MADLHHWLADSASLLVESLKMPKNRTDKAVTAFMKKSMFASSIFLRH
jgi:hypothetical protein